MCCAASSTRASGWRVAVADAGVQAAARPRVRARTVRSEIRLQLRRDRFARAGLIVFSLIVLMAFVGAPIAAHLLGHGPNQLNPSAVNVATGKPVGPWTWVPGNPTYMPHRSLYILGADSTLGRDLFLRLLYGGRTTLEIAFLATIIGVGFGATLGAIAGYFGGRFGAAVVWMTDLVMVFPFLVLGVALWSTVGPNMAQWTARGLFEPGVLLIAGIIGLFSWFYPLRVVRAHMLTLREREFVEAARMTGASDIRILRTHLVPHLAAPVIVYATVIMAAAMIAEVGLAFLAIRVPLPTASWGGVIADSTRDFRVGSSGPVAVSDPFFALLPVFVIVVTVVSLNLAGEGLRAAFDPRASRGR
jgi:ABC-type dipeptide/oligopeptide/nickel transport system permease subunit